jgi:hypothetical protein
VLQSTIAQFQSRQYASVNNETSLEVIGSPFEEACQSQSERTLTFKQAVVFHERWIFNLGENQRAPGGYTWERNLNIQRNPTGSNENVSWEPSRGLLASIDVTITAQPGQRVSRQARAFAP